MQPLMQTRPGSLTATIAQETTQLLGTQLQQLPSFRKRQSSSGRQPGNHKINSTLPLFMPAQEGSHHGKKEQLIEQNSAKTNSAKGRP
jgi:hypothetical protein